MLTHRKHLQPTLTSVWIGILLHTRYLLEKKLVTPTLQRVPHRHPSADFAAKDRVAIYKGGKHNIKGD